MSIQIICVALLLLSQHLLGEELQFLGGELGDKPKKDKSIKRQRVAVDTWAKELTPDDYSIEKWPSITGHNQPQHIFDFYAQKISDSFAANKAKVNFVLVGACDGTHDKTIRDRFLPNENWNGVFVEPITMNFKDLNKFLADNKVESRSITIQAAVTDECKTPTVPMKVAKYEEKDPNLPHWMRREIGSILAKASDVKKLGEYDDDDSYNNTAMFLNLM